MSAKCVLVTGGAGYIGSHVVIELLNAGYEMVVVDNLTNSSKGPGTVKPAIIQKIEEISGKVVTFYGVDILDKKSLIDLFAKHQFFAVLHLASLKAVGESVKLPLKYYMVNVTGTLNLLEVMNKYNVKNILFSSSHTVYGTPKYLPLDEKHPVGECTNPYGSSKCFVEQVLADLYNAEKDWNIIIMRYFNPVGSHKSGLIGEDPDGIPSNLMPYVAQVAVGKRTELKVFGDDYDTHDGTGVRDYIHVVDLATSHIAALKKLKENPGCKTYNIGTGKAFSVLDIIKGVEKASGKKIAYKVVARRNGDVGSCYSDSSLAEKELGWKAEKGEDLWRWQGKNTN